MDLSNSTDNCPFAVQSDSFAVEDDGSVVLSVKLDKDQIQCCVCYSFMSGCIFRCQNFRHPHNVCADCEWQIRRLKNPNGHSKIQCCPICKHESPFVRNYGLEKQLYKISNPCVNQKRGCRQRFFPWDETTRSNHFDNCTYGTIVCPLCDGHIDNGVEAFVAHLEGTQAETGCPYKLKSIKKERGVDKHTCVTLTTGESSYVINENAGYLIIFDWKDFYFDVTSIAFSPGLGSAGNDQICIEWVNTKQLKEYENSIKEKTYCHTPIPVSNSIRINMLRLRSPKFLTQKPYAINSGQIFCGVNPGIHQITVRFFTLADDLCPGSIMDCRDFTGKWFEAEVTKIMSVNTSSVGPSQSHVSPILNRRISVHYLGYSANYDEWFDLSQDAHRLACRGTFTVGPNLRAQRRIGSSFHRQAQRRQSVQVSRMRPPMQSEITQ